MIQIHLFTTPLSILPSMEKYIPPIVLCILLPGTNRIDGNENEKTTVYTRVQVDSSISRIEILKSLFGPKFETLV